MVPNQIQTVFSEKAGDDLFTRQKWWVLLRWFFLGIVIATILIGQYLIGLQSHLEIVFPLSLAVAGVNTLLSLYFFALQRRAPLPDSKWPARLSYVQVALDWAFITLVFHYTGGLAGPLVFFILVHVILSSVLLEKQGSFRYRSFIALTILLLALAEYNGFIPHIYEASFISRKIQDNLSFVLLLLFFWIAALYGSGYFVDRVLKQLREKIRLLVELQAERQQAGQRLEILNQLARETSSTLGLTPRLELICQHLRNILNLKGVAIRLLDEKTKRLELVSSCGLSREYINKGPVDADKSLAKALEGEVYYVPDATSDPAVQYPGAAQKEGIVSLFAFPLQGREKVIGTIRLYFASKRALTKNETDFILALTRQSAIFFENAKVYDVLEREDKAKSEFIMLMTHELKGPLMAMQSLLEVMSKGHTGDLSEKQKEIIRRIQNRIDSVLEVSTSLLDNYQWQTQRTDEKRTALSLNEQLQKVVDLFKATAEKKDLALTLSQPAEDCKIMGTENDLEKILNNLVTNAIKYTPQGGRISLELISSQSRAVMIIKDTGIGISPEDLPHIFDGFYRAKEAKQIDPYGRGMGLSFIKKVVETLGGTIQAKGQTGQGMEFTLSFPQSS